jgi:hypothetical protein
MGCFENTCADASDGGRPFEIEGRWQDLFALQPLA